MRNIMSPLIGLAVAIGLVSPAAADWVITNGASDGVIVARGAYEDGHKKFEVTCNTKRQNLFFGMGIHTGEPYNPQSVYPDNVPISVKVDGQQQPIVNGSFRNVDGQLVAFATVSTGRPLAQILGAMAASEYTIDVQFAQRLYRFSPKGVTAAMRHLQEKCQ